MLNDILENITKNKKGVEIGGPSSTGKIIYENSLIVDNVIFSKILFGARMRMSVTTIFQEK